MPQEVIRLNLLPQGIASIARDGIRFQGLRYTCNLAETEGWFINARERGRQKITIAYDQRRVDAIYLRQDNHHQIVPCHLLPKFKPYRGLDWYDVLEHIALSKQRQKQAQTGQFQSGAAYQSRVAHIVQQAQSRQEQSFAKQSKAARLKGIRDNRREERRLERQEHPWQLGDAPPQDIGYAASEEEEGGYIPEPHKIDLLRRALPTPQEEVENDAG